MLLLGGLPDNQSGIFIVASPCTGVVAPKKGCSFCFIIWSAWVKTHTPQSFEPGRCRGTSAYIVGENV